MSEGWKELLVRRLWLAVVFLAAVLFAAITVPMNNWLTNTGFLVVGAVVSVAGSFAVDAMRRQAERLELAEVLYVELAQHVARICFDAEAPWNTVRQAAPDNWPIERVSKFAPEHPHVYNACLPRLALLGSGPPARLMQFYYRLAALRRDITAAVEDNRGALVPHKTLKRIARRQLEALAPGRAALDELQRFVADHEALEAAAIGGFDTAREEPPTASFRTRIASLLKE